MKILAITTVGREFMYSIKSARAVSARSAATIARIVNENKYLLQPGQIWHCYDIDKYDAAYDTAQFQRFTIRKGIVSDCRY